MSEQNRAGTTSGHQMSGSQYRRRTTKKVVVGSSQGKVKPGRSTLTLLSNQTNQSAVIAQNGPNVSNRGRDNMTLNSQEKNYGSSVNGPDDMAHLLHDKQYTPDLKQSDCRLSESAGAQQSEEVFPGNLRNP